MRNKHVSVKPKEKPSEVASRKGNTIHRDSSVAKSSQVDAGRPPAAIKFQVIDIKTARTTERLPLIRFEWISVIPKLVSKNCFFLPSNESD